MIMKVENTMEMHFGSACNHAIVFQMVAYSWNMQRHRMLECMNAWPRMLPEMTPTSSLSLSTVSCSEQGFNTNCNLG